MKVCQANGVDHGDVKRGDHLGVSRSYFTRAYEVTFEVGVKLAHVLWRKVRPGERLEADRNLLSIGYELLVEEKYDLARAIHDFGAVIP